MKTSKLFALILAIATGLAVLAGSVAVPILCRQSGGDGENPVERGTV